MEETKVAPTEGPAEEGRSKTVVLVGVDDSDHSYRALEWAVRHALQEDPPYSNRCIRI
jgi:hypothetical protein